MTTARKTMQPFTVALPNRSVLVSTKRDEPGEEDDEGNVWRVDVGYTMRSGHEATASLRFATKAARDRAFRSFAKCTAEEQVQFAGYLIRQLSEMEDMMERHVEP